MAYIYDLTDTWNASGTTFNGIKLNVTDSASASSSKLVTLQTNGTEHFSITKAGVGYISGNLGVGTTSATTGGGKVVIEHGANNGLVINQSAAASPATIYLRNIVDTTPSKIMFMAGNGLTFADQNGNERMRITSSGNVGIGTSSPSSRLTITGGTTEIRDGNYLMLRPVGNGWDMRLQATGTQLDVLSGGAPGSPIMSLVNGGNVGIGTTSPGQKLEVNGITKINTASAVWEILQLVNTQGASGAYMQMVGAPGGTVAIGADATTASTMIFRTAGTEKARITSGGFLLVGTTSPLGGNTSSEFKVTGAGSWPLTLNANDRGLLIRNSAASSGIYAYFEYNGGTNNGQISWSGGTTSYTTTSDARVKKNIVDAPDAGALIDAIKVRSWDFKVDDMHWRYGMVAQELISIAPEAVTVPEDEDKMMGIDYSKLVPMLIKEVQSLRARVAQLEGN